jgi:transposase
MILNRHRDSGLSVRAFCQREGLKDSDLLRWRRELSRRDRETIAPLPDRAAHDSARSATTPVSLPVRVVDAADRSGPPSPIEILLPEGPTLRVPAGFDPRTLSAILAVLEGRRC